MFINIIFSVLQLVVFLLRPASGPVLLEENFSYAAGDTLSNLSWEQIRNGSPITITGSGLEWNDYALSGIGNAAQISSTGGQEVRKTFSKVTTDSLYVSFMINVTDAPTVSFGGLYLYLVPEDGNIFSRSLTAYLKKNDSDMLSFGVSKGSGINYTGFNYQMNTTYLIVLKYTFNQDTSHVVSLWVNPDLAAPESRPDAFTYMGNDVGEISGIVLSQLTASNEPPDALIDGIRVTTTWQTISVGITGNNKTPHTFNLEPNYPNPFNPRTMIRYTLGKKSEVRLSVYNLLGQQVAVLVDEIQSAGTHRISWDGGAFAAGVYFYRLQAGSYSETRRMLYVK